MEFNINHRDSTHNVTYADLMQEDFLPGTIRASEGGDSSASFRLAEMCMDGTLGSKDNVQALAYATTAQQQVGGENALFDLGKLYQKEGSRSSFTWSEYAKQCFEIAANQFHHVGAAVELIRMLSESCFSESRLTETDIEIEKLSKIIQLHGDENTKLALGELHLTNTPLQYIYPKARKLLEGTNEIPTTFPRMHKAFSGEVEKPITPTQWATGFFTKIR